MPRGYGYTLLYGLGLVDDNDESTDNSKDYCGLNVWDSTIYLNDIVSSTTYYPNIDRNKRKATLYLYGDIIRVMLTVKQYQSWWWGDQPLYSEEVAAYVICNLHDVVEYS